MNDDRAPLTFDETRARDAVRGLDAPAARPAFRERLRREFVDGSIAAAPRRVIALPWTRRPAFRWIAAPVAAAALLLAVTALNHGPRWQVIDASGDGLAIVDGRPVPLGHREDLARAIRPGARVQMPDGARLEIVSPGVLAIQLMNGVDMTVPSPPGRWFGRRTEGEVRKGELRITTGAGFHGAQLHLATVEAEVQVTGTTLAVICAPEGTCVCVLEGVVKVGEREGTMMNVEHGMRRFVYNDTRPPIIDRMLPQEKIALAEFRAQREQAMGGAAR